MNENTEQQSSLEQTDQSWKNCSIFEDKCEEEQLIKKTSNW